MNKEQRIEEIEREIDRLVKRYDNLQKTFSGDSYYSKEIEYKIDNLNCVLEKLKQEQKVGVRYD